MLAQSASWDAAEVEARRALELDPGQARASRVLGDVELYGRLRIAAAGSWYRRAAILAPTEPDILMAWGWWLIANGDTDAAIEALHTALRWDPVSPVSYGDGPWFYFFAGRLDEAVAESRRGMELLPELRTATSCLVAVAMVRGDADEVARILGKDVPDSATRQFELFVRRNIEKISNGSSRPRQFSQLARWHALIGETDQALDALARAFERREVDLIFLATDPRLDSLRSDPRFDELLARLVEFGQPS